MRSRVFNNKDLRIILNAHQESSLENKQSPANQLFAYIGLHKNNPVNIKRNKTIMKHRAI